MFGHMTERRKGILSLVFLAAVYGGTGALTRYLDHYFTLFQQIYLRTLIAFILGIFFFGKYVNFGKLRKISAAEWLLLFARSGALFVVAAPLWVKATTLTKLANVAFVDALPITAALGFLFRFEKVTVKKVVLLLISFIGVVIISVKDWSNLTSIGIGELLVFISGFFFAFRNVARRWHSGFLNDAEITQIMSFMGILMLVFASFLFGEKLIVPLFQIEWVVVLLIGGLTMVANIYLSNYGFAHVPAVFGNNILNLEAVFAILFGFFLYGEVSIIKELIGGALIIVSVVGMNKLK